MARLSILAVVCTMCAASCGGSNTSPTSPAPATTAPPNRVVFKATLLPANEVPASVGPETSGSGTMTITMNMTRDSAGTITAATMDFLGLFSGFPAGVILTGAHIHPGAAGVNGGIVINTAIAAGEVTFPNGSGSLVKNGINVVADTATSVLNNPSGFYFNIHTAVNPGGVARGQLARTE